MPERIPGPSPLSGQPPPPAGPRNLHAPWRQSYMDMLSREGHPPLSDSDAPVRTSTCFLREYYLNPQSDRKNLVVVRTGVPAAGPSGASPGGLILLNRFPYANGHLLVCLGDGRPRLLDYTQAQRAELWSLVDLAVELCERTLQPQGVNVGLNQGMAAGAGVPDHVHVHVVPRWSGDVNFMSVVANIRVIPGALEEMAARYHETWKAMVHAGS